MKNILYSIFLILLFFSCKTQKDSSPNAYSTSSLVSSITIDLPRNAKPVPKKDAQQTTVQQTVPTIKTEKTEKVIKSKPTKNKTGNKKEETTPKHTAQEQLPHVIDDRVEDKPVVVEEPATEYYLQETEELLTATDSTIENIAVINDELAPESSLEETQELTANIETEQPENKISNTPEALSHNTLETNIQDKDLAELEPVISEKEKEKEAEITPIKEPSLSPKKNQETEATTSVNPNYKAKHSTVDTGRFLWEIGIRVTQILDVRTLGEFKNGHIYDAVNIPIDDPSFKNQLYMLDKNNPVAVYSNTGIRSEKAARILAESGFLIIYNLEGGLDQWKKEKKEIVR